MNYRHAFHAGNFADVFKHIMLTRILDYLKRKPAPMRFIDTHAGIGGYDLSSEESQRTGEWRNGIALLLEAECPDEVAQLLKPYFDVVGRGIPVPADPQRPGRYPGSPVLAQALLRPLDKLIFCELHPSDIRKLNRNIGKDRRVKVIEIDGYTGLRAYVPPLERRGLVLIDPPFEKPDEFSSLARNLVEAWQKWPTGTYCVWYPLKAVPEVNRFFRTLTDAGISDVLCLELSVGQSKITDEPSRSGLSNNGLSNNGLAIINPPYVLEEEARLILPFLCDTLARGPGANWRIDKVSAEHAPSRH
jgi:23S rRNA (adenine2030-N6)-methyltransferase